MDEIVGWRGYTDDEKIIVMKRLSQLLSQVLEEKILVVSPELLRSQLEKRQIEVIYPSGDDECVQALLCSAAGQLLDPEAFGLEILPGYADMSPLKLRDLVDSEYHQLALADYERYVGP
ncbi:MAG: hypothetical protein ACI9GW_001512 [Halieaceae bacterium]|jgi:hypothetical protein